MSEVDAPSPIPPNPFSPGDVVQLNSGGERLTVSASNADTTWITYWDERLVNKELPTACLRLFEEGEAGE